MSMPICELEAITLRAPDGGVLLSDVALSVTEGSRVMVVGPDRAASTALLRLIAGCDADDNIGIQRREGVSVEFHRLDPVLDPTMTVWDYVSTAAAEAHALIDRADFLLKYHLQHTEDDESEYMEELDQLDRRRKELGAWDLEMRMRNALEALRCPAIDAKLGDISSADRRRVALGRALIARPQLLVLDQPTDELDAVSAAWFEQALAQHKGTLVVATNDRALINSTANTLIVLDPEGAHEVNGGYATWLEQRLAAATAGPRRTAIERELGWMNAGTPARSTKARPGASTLNRWLARRDEVASEATEITIAPGPRLGDDVIELRQASQGIGNRSLIDNLSLQIPPGAIVGVVGGEGSGKSTLLRLLAGLDSPDDGVVNIDAKVVLGLLDESTVETAPDVSVFKFVTAGRTRIEVGERSVDTVEYLGVFGFDQADRELSMAAHSTRMRARAHLAKLLLAGVNVVLLDEPTRSLDIDALRALEDALQRFAGCAVIVSNDRWFLNRVATHMLAFEGDSQAMWLEGNYDTYVASHMRRHGTAALRPGRLRFKRRSSAA